MDVEQFPTRLKSMRILRQLTQAKLADHAHLHKSEIAHFETHTRLPSCTNLCRLADALEVSTDYLLGRVETWRHQPVKADIIEDYQELSSHSQTLARKIVRLLREEEPYRGDFAEDNGA